MMIKGAEVKAIDDSSQRSGASRAWFMTHSSWFMVNDVGSKMKLIDKQLLDDVSRQAKESPRLRMNHNFHQSLEDKCHRFLNAVEPDARGQVSGMNNG